MKRLTTEEFIKKAREVHGDTYDYSNVVYINYDTKIKIISKHHGEFIQTPNSHLQGKGCTKCGKQKAYKNRKTVLKKKRMSQDEFVQRATEIHSNEFDYSKTIFNTVKDIITIICPKHGEFTQRADYHLYDQQGCPICKSSKGEKTIRRLLKEYNVNFEEQKKFKSCRNTLQLSFDFFIPSHKTLIEYQGKQHFEGWNGSKNSLKLIQKRDLIKNQWAYTNGYNLLYINYNEDIKSRLKKLLYESNILTQAESSTR